MRRSRLNGSVYRYWSSYAIAYVLAKRLSGKVDFLDAGGRDGGTIELLRNMSLGGRYTCLDLAPSPVPWKEGNFDVEAVQSRFEDYHPNRQYDVVLFEGSMECVEDCRNISWLGHCLKPGGFVVVTVATKNAARCMYPGFWKDGGRYGRDRDEVGQEFRQLRLIVEEIIPLVGATGRIMQYMIWMLLGAQVRRLWRKTIGVVWPKLRDIDPMIPVNRLVNETTRRVDRLFPFWRIGHCIVLRPIGDTTAFAVRPRS